MQDPDLAASYGIMQASIEELAQTVGYASYAEIKSTQAITVTISAKADEIDDNIKKFRDQLGQDVRLVYESQLEMRAELAEGFHTTQAMLLEQAALQAERDARFHASVLKAIQGGKSKPENADNKRKQNTKGSGKGDPGDKKFKALRNIKAFFDSHAGLFPNWRDAYKENASQQTDMRDAYVEHTADWITNDSAFQQWAEGKNPLLWMKGPDGIGKSFLAHASLQKLPTRDEGSNSIAYFYFKEDFPYLQSAQNSFACAALQVAEANTKYAEQIAAKLKEDAENATSTPTWERFFLTVFGTSPSGTSSSDHLYLIFDGLDEAPKEQQELFLEFLKNISEAKSRVHIMVTSRPSVEAFKEVYPLIVEVTKEKVLGDMRMVVGNRINTFGRLRKFSPRAKAIIRRTVLKHADGRISPFNSITDSF
jgi:DNA replication protein DnaC